MILNFRNFRLLCFIFSLAFCFVIKAEAQKAAPTLADKREIIKALLDATFTKRGFDDKTIYISKQNLPTAIRNKFPRIKDVRIKLVSENLEDSSLCPYQFGNFSVIDKFVTVSFGNCNEALAYNFEKIRGKWKNVPLVIEK